MNSPVSFPYFTTKLLPRRSYNVLLIYFLFFLFHVQVLFKIFDVDEDGVISQEELLEMVRGMSGERLSEEEMQVIVDHTFRLARLSERGIYFSDFYEVCSN